MLFAWVFDGFLVVFVTIPHRLGVLCFFAEKTQKKAREARTTPTYITFCDSKK